MLSLQRSKFSLPANSTYLNCGYMSPLLKSVEKVGLQALKGKRYPVNITAKDFFTGAEHTRQEFSKLVNAKDSNRIALTPSTSYGIANAARNIRLSASEKVIVIGEEFPSNYYSWHRLCLESNATLQNIAPPDVKKNRGKIWNERILDAIDMHTRVVAMGNIHWADGTIFDLKAIRKRTLEVGALLIIDGTQSVGALPFNIQSIQPDALICSGYKWLMGPYSVGMAYYGPYFDRGTPIEENWINRLNSEDFAGLVSYENQYQPGALRYQVGEHSNFMLGPMMLEALKQINKWNPKHIQAYCHQITAGPIQILRENGFWIETDKYRAKHLFGIRLPEGMDIKAVKAKLQRQKISVSFRGDAIRVSPYLYNQEKDLMKLVKVLLA